MKLNFFDQYAIKWIEQSAPYNGQKYKYPVHTNGWKVLDSSIE